MSDKKLPPPAGGRRQTKPRFNPYDTDPYDPLSDPASDRKPPLARDDASNVNPQPRPDESPGPARPGRSA